MQFVQWVNGKIMLEKSKWQLYKEEIQNPKEIIKDSRKTIFVSIAAYNEEDLEQTIDNALKNALYTERIYFGVYCHKSDLNHKEMNYPNLKIIYTTYPNVLGVGLARANSFSLYDNQDYFFQIDGHMLFEKNWDKKVISAIKKIQLVHDKPIISTYVPWWARLEDGEILHYSPDIECCSYPMKYIGLLDYHPPMTTEFKDYGENEEIEHYGISGHFIFTLGSFVKDVLPDPEIMFAGEEETIALRAWTRGYRIYSIKNPIAWHKNKGAGVVSSKDRSVNFGPQEDHDFWVRKNKLSLDKVKDIMTGNLIGIWGAASFESFKEYEKAAGVDFNKMYENQDLI